MIFIVEGLPENFPMSDQDSCMCLIFTNLDIAYFFSLWGFTTPTNAQRRILPLQDLIAHSVYHVRVRRVYIYNPDVPRNLKVCTEATPLPVIMRKCSWSVIRRGAVVQPAMAPRSTEFKTALHSLFEQHHRIRSP